MPACPITIRDAREEGGPQDTMCYEGGIREFAHVVQPE